MIKKITSFTHHTTAEGERISYTYSLIDNGGDIVKSNERADIIAVDEDILTALKTVDNFLQTKIPE